MYLQMSSFLYNYVISLAHHVLYCMGRTDTHTYTHTHTKVRPTHIYQFDSNEHYKHIVMSNHRHEVVKLVKHLLYITVINLNISRGVYTLYIVIILSVYVCICVLPPDIRESNIFLFPQSFQWTE